MEVKQIIVIGSSAGGIKAVNQLLSKLSPGLPIAVFVVIHMSKNSQAEIIRTQFQRATNYECQVAADGEPITAGKIYIAPANHHLFIKRGIVRLTNGPHENRWRPSIDVLFRSAAAAYDSHVIGIILTGMLDDGTSGMSAIKRSGGICIVQEPGEAEFEDMPANVLNNVQVDYQVLINDMGYIIEEILTQPKKDLVPIPEDVKIEAAITERMISSIDEMERIGEHSNFTCPDCGGNLWKMKHEDFARYRCHTGHVYTENALMEKQNEALEESLWISVRMLEERKNLFLNLAGKAGELQSGAETETTYRQKAAQLAIHIDRLKKLLVAIGKTGPADEGYL
ncbi:two-component system, chemotaxis family, response regulator CheB [Mucilaginibacter pineti]|uniref:protein-glutamate methylesterase n=1 Tax=Mucilaginibacter pineti TaxID=1391627 RepID=A0A1G7H6S6_9SPHI|nr:chemotaxis protein CheB [Mucilaginibacter pineti]SDE96033.1 two-component system, chemotaxis family, response regulator CheB [Mucilaginibacter pineti]